jgi:hypothetical protein
MTHPQPHVIVNFLAMNAIGGFAVMAASIASQHLLSLSAVALPQKARIVLIIASVMFISSFRITAISSSSARHRSPSSSSSSASSATAFQALNRKPPSPPHRLHRLPDDCPHGRLHDHLWQHRRRLRHLHAQLGPKLHLFLHCLSGLCLPIRLVPTLGTAVAGATASNPTWPAAHTENAIGGAIGALLAPGVGFEKVILVLLAFSVVATTSRGVYSVSIAFHIPIHPREHRVPRVIWMLCTASCVVGVRRRLVLPGHDEVSLHCWVVSRELYEHCVG